MAKRWADSNKSSSSGNGWRPTCLDRSTATAATPTKASARPSLLGELRLPPVAKLWQTFTQRADREGWPSARLLATPAERSSDAAQQTLGLPLQPIRQAQPVGRAAIIARTFSCLYRSGT